MRQELGTDYRVSEGELLFERELVRQRLGVRAWLLGFWGIGTYKRNDEIDIRYEVDGQPQVAHITEIVPPRAATESGPPWPAPSRSGRPPAGPTAAAAAARPGSPASPASG